jgi:hypothetical protein
MTHERQRHANHGSSRLHFVIDTGRAYETFRADYEQVAPPFSREDAIKVIEEGGDWDGSRARSDQKAVHRFVTIFTLDPSPVMQVAGDRGQSVM